MGGTKLDLCVFKTSAVAYCCRIQIGEKDTLISCPSVVDLVIDVYRFVQSTFLFDGPLFFNPFDGGFTISFLRDYQIVVDGDRATVPVMYSPLTDKEIKQFWEAFAQYYVEQNQEAISHIQERKS